MVSEYRALAALDSPADAAEAFTIACALFGLPTDPIELRRRYGEGGVFSLPSLLRAAKALEIKARLVWPSGEELARIAAPAIARDKTGGYFVVSRLSRGVGGKIDRLLVHRSNGRPEALSLEAFRADWDGAVILLRRNLPIGDVDRPFGLSWFYGAVLRYRRVLGEVFFVSLALQLLGLATPLFFQVVVDKVLVHQGLSTLDVIAVGLGIVMIFEVVLGGLRSYVFSHTTNRIDVELGARLYFHLIHLPLTYFGSRRVGDSVARVRELENIRQFLTGSTLTLVLDLIFSTIFLIVIYFYSTPLGFIVTLAIPLYAGISALATPALRFRIKEKFRRGAENQSFLVETITGIETIKSTAAEPIVQKKWEEQLASYVSAAFQVTTLGVAASQVAQLVSRTTTLLILYVGAGLVIKEKLTVGELIAVNMLTGQVSNPILRLAQVWQDLQQVQISVDRVGDILNFPAEKSRPLSTAARPELRGRITFESVRFRYSLESPPTLDNLNLDISPGQIVGVVGPSGSGKSTLVKLMQRLYIPEAGRVLVDGLDLSMVDPAWLRRQVGVVLQDSVLFRGSIRDNICFAEPGLPMDRVIAAARLAGAHEFIAALPAGYDTAVGERGGTLSGGQRQRIAIARTLATNPRILIFDEGTSALDLESEQAIHANMAAISRGRTVVIVAHRLTAIRFATRIITIELGRITEDGTPPELLKAGGRFAHLCAAQSTNFAEGFQPMTGAAE